MSCEANPCQRYIEIRDRSERRGDELFALKRSLTGYVNDWRNGDLTDSEAMVSIQALADAFMRS